MVKCNHTILNTKCPNCRALKKKWESKLGENLKENISQASSYEFIDELDQPTADTFSHNEYFRLLNERLECEDLTIQDQFILTAISQGKEIKQIVEELKYMSLHMPLFKMKPYHRETVRLVVRRFEHKWGIRTWDLKKMYPKPRPGTALLNAQGRKSRTTIKR